MTRIKSIFFNGLSLSFGVGIRGCYNPKFCSEFSILKNILHRRNAISLFFILSDEKGVLFQRCRVTICLKKFSNTWMASA